MTETYTNAILAALAEVRRIKAPTKRVARIAALLIELPTQAEAELFVRALRVEAKVQDVTLLPDTTWIARQTGAPHGTVMAEWTTAELTETLASSESVSISWPSVHFHWGVMVTFTWGGVRYVAHSADYQLTETYLSA